MKLSFKFVTPGTLPENDDESRLLASLCLTVCTEKPGCNWAIIREISYRNVFTTVCNYRPNLSAVTIGLKHKARCVSSSFRRDVDEICALLGFYAAKNGSFLQKNCWYHIQASSSSFKPFILEDGTSRLSQKPVRNLLSPLRPIPEYCIYHSLPTCMCGEESPLTNYVP